MAQTNLSGPLAVGNGVVPGPGNMNPTMTGLFLLLGLNPGVQGEAVEGGQNTSPMYQFGKGGIADSAATSICRFSIPNANHSAVFHIFVRAGITNASHTYDSTRVVLYLLALTRVAGAAVVGALSSAIGAAIATSAGGQTITVTGGLSGVTGGVTATNTIDFQLTNVNASAGTTEAQLWVTGMNALSSGVTVAQV